ncbi:MAG: hypothetical protein IJX79_05900 [Clostridia bacterium]|nr:hypothetical protein [Clostridia bacterium]
MFGYVRAYKPEMRVKEFEMYKAIYCSLCKKLGKTYGILSRFTLNYDFTFLCLLELSLSEKPCELCRKNCTFNPFKKCNYCTDLSEGFDLPAAAAMIMLYYKITDNIEDEKGIKRLGARVAKMVFSSSHKKAAKAHPETEKIVADYIAEQREFENQGKFDLDAAADPTAKALGKIFLLFGKNSADQRILRRLGYCIGRYIYIIDAVSDYESDLKHGSYNPFNGHKVQEMIESAKQAVNLSAAEAARAFELLDICKFKDILGNIIYLGLEETSKEVFEKVGKEKNK